MDKTSLGFQKPKEEEYYDINIFNQNAQLANDLIEKNSSAIGQKLDKDSSFYADLEAYYGNTKLISDFQDLSEWIPNSATPKTDTTNVKLGSKSLKISEINNNAGVLNVYKNLSSPLDLTKLNNGEESTDNDYLKLVIYISDVTKVEYVALAFGQTADVLTLNRKVIVLAQDSLITGWNFFNLKKSHFGTEGTGAWSNINISVLEWRSLVNAQNAYVSFQLIQLVKKDPLEDKPNPFQKFGNREIDTVDNEEFCLYPPEKPVINVLFTKGAVKSLMGSKISGKNEVISSFTKKMENSNIHGYLAFYKDGDNYVALWYSTGKLYLSVYTNNTSYSSSIDVSNIGEEAILSLRKEGSKYSGQIYSVDTDSLYEITNNAELPVDVSPCIGFSTFTIKYASFSITQLKHAHNADIAEVANNLAYRDLKVPSININDYFKEICFSIPNPESTSQLEFTIDLGAGYYTGTLEVILSSSFYSFDAIGSITKSVSFAGSANTDSIILKESKYKDLSGATKDSFSISDVYIENKRKKIKVIQKSGGRNYASITLRFYGASVGFDKSTISDWLPNSETFVLPSITPKETIITSGFATGWSGQLKYGITQEGELYINHTGLSKTSDIFHFEVLYQFPSSLLRYIGSSSNIGVASTGSVVNNSSVTLYLESSGRLIATNHGSVTTGVRKIIDGTIVASKY